MAFETEYPAITSSLDLRGEQFRANKAAWIPVLERFHEALKATAVEGNERSLENHRKRGQLLGWYWPVTDMRRLSTNYGAARDRISLLLDQDSPFLELCSFAGFDLPESSPCASLIVGIGSVRYVRIHRQIWFMLMWIDHQQPAVSNTFSCAHAEWRSVERTDWQVVPQLQFMCNH